MAAVQPPCDRHVSMRSQAQQQTELADLELRMASRLDAVRAEGSEAEREAVRGRYARPSRTAVTEREAVAAFT